MYVLVEKDTNKLIEMQVPCRAGFLLQEGIRRGYDPNKIIEKKMTEEQYYLEYLKPREDLAKQKMLEKEQKKQLAFNKLKALGLTVEDLEVLFD